jgi:hypothetical protein
MIGVSVRSNLKFVLAEFSVRAEDVNKATFRALNRALDQSATAANREIRKRYNVKAAIVSAAMKKKRAREKSTYPVAVLEITGARLGLANFDARERIVKSARGRRRGVSVKVLVGGDRKLVQGGFLATRRYKHWRDGSDQAHTMIFKRVGRERYPIKTLRSISIPGAFAHEVVQKAVRAVAIDSFERNLRQQIRFLGSR